MSKFKKGDRVVIARGWLVEEYGISVIGTVASYPGKSLRVELDEPTKCRWKYETIYTSPEDVDLEALHNSSLMKALR